MAEVINLNRARKAKARVNAQALADANAVKFGRRKGDKDLDRAKAEKAARDLDAHRRDPE